MKLTATKMIGLSEHGSNGDKGVHCTLQITRTRPSLSDAL